MKTADYLVYARAMRLDEGEFDESRHPRDASGRFSTADQVKEALLSAKAIYNRDNDATKSYHRFADFWHGGLRGRLPENEAKATDSYMGISGNDIGGIKDEFDRQLLIRGEQAARHAVEAARLYASGKDTEAEAFARSSGVAREIHTRLMTGPKGQARQRYEKLKASPPKQPDNLTAEGYAKYQKKVAAWQRKVEKERDWYRSLAVE